MNSFVVVAEAPCRIAGSMLERVVSAVYPRKAHCSTVARLKEGQGFAGQSSLAPSATRWSPISAAITCRSPRV